MNNIDIVWLAGFLEGEGTFGIRKNDSVYISAASTDIDVLEYIKGIFEGSIYKVTKRKEHWKDAWVWTLTGNTAVKLYKKLLPRMASRRSERIDYVLTRHAKARLRQKAKKAYIYSRRERVKKLRKEGLTHQAIAAIVGLERSSISYILKG